MKFSEKPKPAKTEGQSSTQEAINANNKAIIKFIIRHAFQESDAIGTTKQLEVLVDTHTGEIVGKKDDKLKGKVTDLTFLAKKMQFRGATEYQLVFEMHKMMTFQHRAIETLRFLKDNFNK